MIYDELAAGRESNVFRLPEITRADVDALIPGGMFHAGELTAEIGSNMPCLFVISGCR